MEKARMDGNTIRGVTYHYDLNPGNLHLGHQVTNIDPGIPINSVISH
jgi:hypothetical protein